MIWTHELQMCKMYIFMLVSKVNDCIFILYDYTNHKNVFALFKHLKKIAPVICKCHENMSV